MATDVERLRLELSADISRMERGLKSAASTVDRFTRSTERRFDEMNKRTTRSVGDMGAGIRNAIAGIALGAAVREVQQYADAWTRMGNPLRAAGMSQADVNARMDELVGISLRSRSSLEGTVTLYNRLIAASGELGVSQERVARVVETVNKALATSNMTGSERQSAMVQLAQGLGSGTLAGDELKAIRENSQVLAQAIADEFDTTIGGLKKLGAEGELTATRVFKALEVAQSGVDAAFARTTSTIGDSFTNLQTRAMQFIGQLDESTGASEKFAAAVGFVAENLDAFADAAVVAATVIGGALAGRAMAGVVASFVAFQAQIAITNAQLAAFEIHAGLASGALGRMTIGTGAAAGAMRGLSGAMAFLGGGIGISVMAIAGAFTALALEVQGAKEQTRRYNEIIKENAEALAEAASVTVDVGDGAAGAVSGVDALCDATGRLKDETWELVDAQKEAIRTRIANAIDAIDEERGKLRNPSLLRRILPVGGVIGAGAAADADRSEKLATDRAALMSRLIDLSLNNERRLRGSGNRGGGGGGGGGRTGGGRTRTGPTPEELAATREMLDLQMALDRLSAQGRAYDAEQVQAVIDKINLTKQLTDAGVENAAQVASEQVDAIRLAESAARGREAIAARAQTLAEAAKEAQAAYNAELDRQLQVQIELARIEGNEALVLMLERELSLRQQIAALGPTATPDQIAGVRADEAMLNRAEDRAILTEQGQDMARSFVDILRAEDIGTEIGNRFRQAAFDKLEEVLGNLFSQIMAPQAGGGGGIFGAIASGIGSLFGGRRALGGPVKAGKFYKVNENTPNSEYFAPTQDGYVGNMKPARAQAIRGPVQMTFRTEYNLQGAAGTEAILGTVQRMQAASERRILTTVQAAAPNVQLEQRLLRE